VPFPVVTAYLRWALVRAALARGWWLCTAVYLVVDAGLSSSQLILIGVFQGLTVVAAEVPAGVLADSVSRRLTLVVAHVVMGTGMAITGGVTSFAALVLSQCSWGLGWALSSGADVAWVTDELDRPDLIDRVLVGQGRRELWGTGAGIVMFGLLGWVTTLATAMVFAGVSMAILGVLVVARWPESWPPAPRHHGRYALTRAVTRHAFAIARRDRVVGSVLVATLVVNGGAEGFGRLFQQRVVALGLPASPPPVVWFAAIALVAAATGVVALWWVEARIGGVGAARGAYIAAAMAAACGVVVFAHAPSLEVAIAGSLLVSGIGLPTIRVASTVAVNRRTSSDVRATMHSLLSQSENLGEIVCGLVLAAVASQTSPTVTLTASAVLMAAAGLVVSRTRRPSGYDASPPT
jgi:MFS family permease